MHPGTIYKAGGIFMLDDIEYIEDSKDPLSEAVKELFGLSYLFPYQRLVIANILEAARGKGISVNWPGEAAKAAAEEEAGMEEAETEDEADDRASYGRQIVILPTGAGKSLCFQLPAMLLSGATLVIYPILSLMADQERRLRERGFSPVILRGGQSREERQNIWEKLDSGESRFIIANPEVLLTPQVKDRLKDLGIVHIVIDEAHCVSEWGESFRPSYLQIGEIVAAAGGGENTDGENGSIAGNSVAALGGPLVTAFTATASAPVLEKIERYIFGSPDNGPLCGVRRIIGNPDRSNIRYTAQGCVLRNLAVRDLLLTNPLPAIVFCSSRPGTEKLAAYLRNELRFHRSAPEIRFYHAGLNREEKAEIESWFFGNPRGVLVSTCAYGMGVDKADIRTVIHRDCPPSVEAYLQESGRAGRDGGASEAVLLWGPDDEAQIRRAKSEADRQRIRELLNYARNTSSCRRQALLTLLNYEGSGECPETRCCDVCDGAARAVLREDPAIPDFFRKNRRSFTLGEAAEILSCAENIGWSAEEAKQAVEAFIRMGRLRVSRNILWKNKINLAEKKFSFPPGQVHR
jgi:ATP-dependent DNA helicase RecQ